MGGLSTWVPGLGFQITHGLLESGKNADNALLAVRVLERFSMAAPVIRRSARLSAKAAATADAVCARGASWVECQDQWPDRAPSQPSSPNRMTRPGGTRCRPFAGTPRLEEVIALKRGKIPAYFSQKAGGGKEKKTVKAKDASEEKSSGSGNNSPEASIEILVPEDLSPTSPLESGQELQVLPKRAKLLKTVPSRDLEAELWGMGFQHIAGVDEAGRGPLAGPVVAAACIIPSSITIEGINDSKKLSEERREELYSKLTTTPGISFAVHVVDAQTIDEVNILQATMLAMAACVEKLSSSASGVPGPDFILVDGNRLPEGFLEDKARSVVKGDASCHVIAAASVLAKVTRDRLMIAYDEKWPVYGFKAHKGYGTAAHMAALLKHGPCDIHRRSFAPLKDQNVLPISD